MARLRYPTGVRPLLIDETARRRRIEERVVSILEREGFAEVVVPIIDYEEPYASAAHLDPRQTYRFVAERLFRSSSTSSLPAAATSPAAVKRLMRL